MKITQVKPIGGAVRIHTSDFNEAERLKKELAQVKGVKHIDTSRSLNRKNLDAGLVILRLDADFAPSEIASEIKTLLSE